jgi:hypothetical protein
MVFSVTQLGDIGTQLEDVGTQLEDIVCHSAMLFPRHSTAVRSTAVCHSAVLFPRHSTAVCSTAVCHSAVLFPRHSAAVRSTAVCHSAMLFPRHSKLVLAQSKKLVEHGGTTPFILKLGSRCRQAAGCTLHRVAPRKELSVPTE